MTMNSDAQTIPWQIVKTNGTTESPEVFFYEVILNRLAVLNF